MRDTIINFNKQFEYEPVIEHASEFKKYRKFFVSGMGGSHLAADLLKVWEPTLDVIVQEDYAPPAIPKSMMRGRLFIASSYSGNTEEVIDVYTYARAHELPLAVVAVGGKLIDLARQDGVPYVQLPDTGIQPRSALGFSLRGLAALMSLNKVLRQTKALVKKLKPEKYEKTGQALAEKFKDYVPVIYASTRNESLAYNWKIKFNETGKIPAFSNVFPEMNHNEMTGFDVQPTSKHLSEKFGFIFLKDPEDHPRVQKRMAVMEQQYRDRGLIVESLELQGKTVWEKIFTSLILADWAAVSTAELYGLESEQVPMVEEFKKLIA